MKENSMKNFGSNSAILYLALATSLYSFLCERQITRYWVGLLLLQNMVRSHLSIGPTYILFTPSNATSMAISLSLCEKYDAPKSQYNTSKYRLLQKFDFKCAYCGCDLTVSNTQKEHVIPRTKGGAGGVKSGNIVPSCFSCNMKKGTKDIEAFRKKLFGKKSTSLFHFETLNNK